MGIFTNNTSCLVKQLNDKYFYNLHDTWKGNILGNIGDQYWSFLNMYGKLC